MEFILASFALGSCIGVPGYVLSRLALRGYRLDRAKLAAIGALSGALGGLAFAVLQRILILPAVAVAAFASALLLWAIGPYARSR